MLAVVMSGGGNYGALQVGALQVLVEHGLQPDMAVGTSAGSLNAIYLASDPTPGGMERLADHWRAVADIGIHLPSFFTTARRFITRKSGLVPQTILRKFLLQTLPPDIDTFGKLIRAHGIRAYAIAVSMERRKVIAFGDRPEDRLLDGAMASTALPPFFGPWTVNGERFLDGGVTSKLPLTEAIVRGAKAIVAIDITEAMGSAEAATGMTAVCSYALSLMITQQLAHALEVVKRRRIPMRFISLEAPSDLTFWDYARADQLLAMGREQTRIALRDEGLDFRIPLHDRLRGWAAKVLPR